MEERNDDRELMEMREEKIYYDAEMERRQIEKDKAAFNEGYTHECTDCDEYFHRSELVSYGKEEPHDACPTCGSYESLKELKDCI